MPLGLPWDILHTPLLFLQVDSSAGYSSCLLLDLKLSFTAKMAALNFFRDVSGSCWNAFLARPVKSTRSHISFASSSHSFTSATFSKCVNRSSQLPSPENYSGSTSGFSFDISIAFSVTLCQCNVSWWNVKMIWTSATTACKSLLSHNKEYKGIH